MSKDSTALGAALEKLVVAGHSVDLTLRPGHGQNKSEGLVTDETGAVVAKFQAKDFATLAGHMVEATRNSGDVTPTATALSVLDYLVALEAGARFAALNGDGDLVINAEFDTPIFHRQRAAAVRNGRAHGAVAILDIDTGEVERISPLTAKKGKS